MGTTTHRGKAMQDDELTPEQIHILYCLHILELTPEETAERVWPNCGPVMKTFYPIYIRWVLANDREARASGEVEPFPKEAFLEWTGFPAEDVARKH